MLRAGVVAALLGVLFAPTSGCSVITDPKDLFGRDGGPNDGDAAGRPDGDARVSHPDADADVRQDVITIPDGATPCEDNGACGSLACVDHYCQLCTDSTECSPRVCSEVAGGVCVGCTSHDQCGSETCDFTSGECGPCSVNADCSNGKVCVGGDCRPCENGSTECAPQLCASAVCTGCSNDSECGMFEVGTDSYYCDRSTGDCRRRCAATAECDRSGAGETCLGSYCVGCDEDGDGSPIAGDCPQCDWGGMSEQECKDRFVDCEPDDPNVYRGALAVCGDDVFNSCETGGPTGYAEVSLLPWFSLTALGGATSIDVAAAELDPSTGVPIGGYVLLQTPAGDPVAIDLSSWSGKPLSDFLFEWEALGFRRFVTIAGADLTEIPASDGAPYLAVFGRDSNGDHVVAVFDLSVPPEGDRTPPVVILDPPGELPVALGEDPDSDAGGLVAYFRKQTELVYQLVPPSEFDRGSRNFGTDGFSFVADGFFSAVRSDSTSGLFLWGSGGEQQIMLPFEGGTAVDRPALSITRRAIGPGAGADFYQLASLGKSGTSTTVNLWQLTCSREGSPGSCNATHELTFTARSNAELPLIYTLPFADSDGGTNNVPLLFAVRRESAHDFVSASTLADLMGIGQDTRRCPGPDSCPPEEEFENGVTFFDANMLGPGFLDIVDFDVTHAITPDDLGTPSNEERMDMLVAALASDGYVYMSGVRLCKEP